MGYQRPQRFAPLSNDAIAPTASISVPTTSGLGIPVSRSGQDDLSGIRHYDVQVRENGGSWTDTSN